MNLAVLLLYTNDNPRQTTFSRNWAEAAVQTVADYIYAQSGGRETVTFKVFEWTQLTNVSTAQWAAYGFGVGAVVRPMVIDPAHDSYTHVLMAIDVPGASGATTPVPYTYLAAQHFLPNTICHELGHVFGAEDAWGETTSGPMVYVNRWDVMAGVGYPYSFEDPSLVDPAAAGLNHCGPNMSTPTLCATGWLNPALMPGTSVELSNSNSIYMAGGVTTQLSALAGGPGPGWSRPPIMIRYNDLAVEYRVRSGWDRGMPNPAPADGVLVVHRIPFPYSSAVPYPTYVTEMSAVVGETLVLGKDNPLDIFHDGPVKITVVGVDAAADTVRVNLSRRPARQPPSTGPGAIGSGRSHPGVIFWTPGMGTTVLGGHAPLVPILTTLSLISSLQSAQLTATEDEAAALAERAAAAIEDLQGQVGRLSPRPTSSPLEHAMELVSELHNAGERFNQDDADEARHFIELSKAKLAEIERALAEAADEER